MAPINDKNVPTPFRHRLRWWRQQLLPLVIWLLAVCGAFLLSSHRIQEIDAVGIMEVQEVSVAPIVDGKVQGLSVDLFDSVQAGQVVALMDDTLVRAELIVAEAELSRLRTEIGSARARLDLEAGTYQIDRLNDMRRFFLNEEEARLDYLDRVIQQEMNKINLQRLEVLLERQRSLVEQNVIDTATYDDFRLQRDVIAVQIEKSEEALQIAKTRLSEAAERREERTGLDVNLETDQLLKPLKEGLKVQEALIARLKEQRKTLVIQSPISGRVARILYRPGATVLAGDPLLTITDPDSSRVVAYVQEGMTREVQVGTPVEIYSRRQTGQKIVAEILKISPKIEQLPLRLQRNPQVPEWGLPVIVGNLPAGVFRPGEALDIRLAALPR